MTLDEDWLADRLLRDSMQDRYWEDHDPTAGSPEAEERMLAEGAAWRRKHEPWRSVEPERDGSADRRLFGWREEERFEEAGLPRDAA